MPKKKLEEKIFLGIDPGITGAAALLSPAGDVLNTWSFSKLGWFRPHPARTQLLASQLTRLEEYFDDFMPKYGAVEAFLEIPLESPGKIGNVSWGYLMYCVGIWQGLFQQHHQIEHYLVRPHVWPARFGIIHQKRKKDAKTHHSPTKEQSYYVAKERFPGAPIKKDNTGLTDALLIAEFGRLLYTEKNGNTELIDTACLL